MGRRRDAGGQKPADSSTTTSLWAKATNPNTPWVKEELHDVVYWARQVLGLVCGLVWGIIPMTGYIGNLSYMGLSALVLFLYYSKYLKGVDVEWYWPLVQEGFFTAYALFLVTWILSYNALHVGAFA